MSVCPTPIFGDGDLVTLAHGEGGRLSRRLIVERIWPTLGIGRSQASSAADLSDAAPLPPLPNGGVFSTDSFVVTPLFFPGGSIGSLAVFGTVNDLAVAGGRPRWLSLSLILEEGLALTTLDRVLADVARCAAEAGVAVVTGDTKVVPRGAVDQLFITTAGVGEWLWEEPLGPSCLRPGDNLLVSGPIGRHGVAILAAREELGFIPAPESDCGSLVEPIMRLWSAGLRPRSMRDATRGGVAAVLHEWAASSGLTMRLEQQRLPVSEVTLGVCELLGLEPLHVANEGTMVLAVSPDQTAPVVEVLSGCPQTAHVTVVGQVMERSSGAPVLVHHGFGREQPLDEPLGAPLPRIC
jgi:hydrogenase expression/formation protein HypE